MSKVWLVEIGLKDWVADKKECPNRTVGYVEVLANDEYSARHIGFDEFLLNAQYSPVARRKWESLNLSKHDICAPAAVELDS